jgi:VanZ family protein
MLFIFYLSSLPASATGPDILIFKVTTRVLHFVIFGILSILYLNTLKWNKSLEETGAKVFLWSLFLTIIYAISDEYHQTFSSGREPSINDVLLDTSGAIVFLGITYKLKSKLKKER